VATYAYVNPVVAVGFGWALRGEAMGWTTLGGASVVLVGVVLVVTGGAAGRRVWPRPRSSAHSGASAGA